MNMIYINGLNCRLACVINIAASLTPDYHNAFITLWSETDFKYEPEYNIFVSEKIYQGFKAAGIKITLLNSASQKEKKKSLSEISDGELFLIGMSDFYIPWSITRGYFHSNHYFITEKKENGTLLCYDPTHRKEDMNIKYNDIINYSFELNRICKIKSITTFYQKNTLKQEAIDVLQNHAEILNKLLIDIREYREKDITATTSIINVMVSNRYLFGHFLHRYSPEYFRFFGKEYFAKWEALKFGLRKILIVKDNKVIIDEVCGYLTSLFREEINAAHEIIRLK